MPNDLNNISMLSPCWTVAAHATYDGEEANYTIETHTHYGAARAFRRLRSLYQKYRTEPKIWVEMIAPDGTHTVASNSTEALARAGRKGGIKTAAKRTPEQRSTFARRAAIARWSKLKENICGSRRT